MKRIGFYKALARISMRNGYMTGVGLCMALMLFQTLLTRVFLLLAGTSQILGIAYGILEIIISIIIISPLEVGMTKFFLEQAQGRVDKNNVFFALKNNHTNNVRICFVREIKLFLWLLIPAIISGAIVYGAVMTIGAIKGMPIEVMINTIVLHISQSEGISYELGLYALVSAVVWGVVIIASIPGIMKSLEYSMINYILSENPDIKCKDAFRSAKEIIKGKRGKLFLLNVSFSGWLLLGAMAYSVGIIFVIPYMRLALAHFYIDVRCADNISDGDDYGSDKENDEISAI